MNTHPDMEKPCDAYLKEGYTMSCDWDYNDDSRGCWSSVFCAACGRERNHSLQEFDSND
jgi:hypothetical protein